MRANNPASRITGAVCATALLLTHTAAESAWEFVPQVDILADANDNPRLLTDSQVEETPGDAAAARMLARVRLEFATFGPRGEATIEPAVQSDAYRDADDEPLESTDAFLRSLGEYRWDTARVGYRADFSRERILGTEFLTALPVDLDLDDPAVVDSVLVGLNERRRRAILSPYAEIELNERATLRLDSRLIDVAYDSDLATSRTDFDDKTFGIELTRVLGPRTTLGGRIYGSRFQAEANENTTDSTGIELRYSRMLSEIWSLNLSSGVERSEFEFVDSEGLGRTGSENNLTFALGFSKEVERARVDLDLRRSVSPDSFGFLTARNEFRAVMRRDLAPNVNGGIAFRYIDTVGLGDELDVDRAYARLELDLAWALGELWSLTTAYQYSQRTVESPSDDADSNAVTLGFRYRGRSRR